MRYSPTHPKTYLTLTLITTTTAASVRTSTASLQNGSYGSLRITEQLGRFAAALEQFHASSAQAQRHHPESQGIRRNVGERLCGYSYQRPHRLPTQAVDKSLFAHTVEGRHSYHHRLGRTRPQFQAHVVTYSFHEFTTFGRPRDADHQTTSKTETSSLSLRESADVRWSKTHATSASPCVIPRPKEEHVSF